MHRTFWSIQRQYREVKGRLFVSYLSESYLVLLKYLKCKTLTVRWDNHLWDVETRDMSQLSEGCDGQK